ncbi:hypothetical protein KEM56_005388, partial [Ascosphaera pollenicola]
MNSRASLHHANDTDAIACSPAQSRLNPLPHPSPLQRAGSPERQIPAQGLGQGQDRPSSPTKGLGGFVQSAMMRRSDSVSKRWSAMNLGGAAGIARRESVSSNHHNEGEAAAILSPSLGGAEGTNSTPTRAGTFHGATGSSSSARPKSLTLKHQRSESISTPTPTSTTTTPALPADNTPTPTSPSKRWSPTKASWLESALNRPESPTKRNPPPAFGQEPEWKSQLARMKASRQAAAAQAAQGKDGKEGEKKENVVPVPALP